MRVMGYNPFDPFGYWQLWWEMSLAPWKVWARHIRVNEHCTLIERAEFTGREVIHVRFGERG